MRNILLLLFLFSVQTLFAQQLNSSQVKTYAVVVGVSDYQDETIPDLRYADKDAMAFASFLRSPAGGGLDDDHLVELINDNATTGKLVSALDWLIEQAQEGDQVIIYFSGHGDVETKTRRQLGFLLTSDSPGRSYMAGAYSIYFLQNVIETISLDNKAKVLLITDACRSGNLAGNAIGGAQLTSQNLATQYANEIKILSCQPNEYSHEGRQWGGGRGAFSYHLLDGLIGMADDNNDLNVTLKEIGRYLEDRVTEEVAPNSQNPMVVGDKTARLSFVSPETLVQIQEIKQQQLLAFSATESRGIEDEVLAKADSNIVELYLAFKESMKNKNFLAPQDSCTDYYYEKLRKEPQLKRLHSSMRRNYAAALQDDAQQVINNWLKFDINELTLSKVNQELKYQAYPAYLDRAADLLGKEHYMYPILKSRSLFFEAYLMHFYLRNANELLGRKILSKYREALKWQPDAAHVYYGMEYVYFIQLQQPDSAEYYAHKATELAPYWILPYSNLGFLYSEYKRNPDRGKYFLELADTIDSTAVKTNIGHISNWGIIYRLVVS